MHTPLNASASSAGTLLSSSQFIVPQFQREYSWGGDEVGDFWADLKNNIDSQSYFLGLVILTEEGQRKQVVDGQQRIITLSLLANAIYHEALARGRKALADRLQADFLRSINYESDETDPRVRLSDSTDDATFQHILNTGDSPVIEDNESVSFRIVESHDLIKRKLAEDLAQDPFKRLGRWTDFLTNRLYFAVFVHPDATSAYQVYEVINTRGRDLTTADLLKNYVLSQTPPKIRDERYLEWQGISRQFTDEGTNNFVQYIRHVVTVNAGHILPKDLFGFLANRLTFQGKYPPNSEELMRLLQERLPLYAQMIDPSLAGPAEPEALKVFAALNGLGVIAVRPILLAISDVPNPLEGMNYVLRLVVRRIIVGNLGTGNVERRFGEAAKKIHDSGQWTSIVSDLSDLNPKREDFVSQIKKRSFNKGLLAFVRRSVIQKSITPEMIGVLHFIWTRQAPLKGGMSEKDGTYWMSTLGNTFLANLDRRPKTIGDWGDFKQQMLPHGINGEWVDLLEHVEEWNVAAVERLSTDLAEAAGEVWYD